ncbi:MAG: hypothetical protein WCO83_02535 [Alphaproteobacteria bacterium]
MDTVPTVKIMPSDPEQGEFILINAEDFDASVHVKYVEPEAPAEPEPEAAGDPSLLTKAEIIADLEGMSVAFDPRATKADLLALRNEARAIRDA